MSRFRTIPLAVAVLVAGVACGGDDDDDAAADEFASVTSSSVPASAGTDDEADADAEPAGPGAFEPVSDVTPHGAVGEDIAAIKTAMEPATKGETVDWAAVSTVFEEGTGASKKGDGSVRTLAGLVADSPAVAFVRDALAGKGASAGASDPVRRQQVDKGISVLLAEKMTEELGRARDKLEAGEFDDDTGAPHNVDEAWAFYVADGSGLASTAEKRAADFKREGKVSEPVLDALTDAQVAAQDGDDAAFDAAATALDEATGYIFYLATFKYLDSDDEVGRAEGASFYRGISARVEQADADAHQAIVSAFAEGGDPAAGRAALNSEPVLAALSVGEDEQVSAVG